MDTPPKQFTVHDLAQLQAGPDVLCLQYLSLAVLEEMWKSGKPEFVKMLNTLYFWKKYLTRQEVWLPDDLDEFLERYCPEDTLPSRFLLHQIKNESVPGIHRHIEVILTMIADIEKKIQNDKHSLLTSTLVQSKEVYAKLYEQYSQDHKTLCDIIFTYKLRGSGASRDISNNTRLTLPYPDGGSKDIFKTYEEFVEYCSQEGTKFVRSSQFGIFVNEFNVTEMHSVNTMHFSYDESMRRRLQLLQDRLHEGDLLQIICTTYYVYLENGKHQLIPMNEIFPSEILYMMRRHNIKTDEGFKKHYQGLPINQVRIRMFDGRIIILGRGKVTRRVMINDESYTLHIARDCQQQCRWIDTEKGASQCSHDKSPNSDFFCGYHRVFKNNEQQVQRCLWEDSTS